jgi:hypothetical protein
MPKTMGYHIVKSLPGWKMLRNDAAKKVSALDGPLGICTCHYDGLDWILSILKDGAWKAYTVLSTDNVGAIVSSNSDHP